VLIDPEMAAVQSGYSAAWAKVHADNLRKELHYYIVAGERAREARRDIDSRVVMNEVANIAFSDVLDFFEVVDSYDSDNNANGSMLIPKQNLKALPAHMRRLIKRIKFDTIVVGNGNTKLVIVSDIELHGKDWALKEMIEILRLKQAGAPKDETSELLEKMSASELAEVEKVFTKAQTRLRRSIDQRKDDDAIDVTPE
jgi:hypothetical protein